MRQGWPASQLYFMRSGYVDLIMNKAVVDVLRDGDFFGEAALMELPSNPQLQQARPAFFVAPAACAAAVWKPPIKVADSATLFALGKWGHRHPKRPALVTPTAEIDPAMLPRLLMGNSVLIMPFRNCICT